MSLTGTVCGNLKKHRIKSKLSQSELAAKVNLSISYISLLERGQRSPPLETVEKLATALGVTPQKLLS